MRPHSATAASNYLYQHDHDRTGIVSAIELIHKGNAKEMEGLNPAKEQFWEEIARGHEWVIEALLQGAFVREYHLWEKYVREYVANQRSWNGVPTSGSWHHDFIVGVELALAGFGAQVPADTLKQLRAIRRKVNKAKHEPGLTINHFISTDELLLAIETYRIFWQCLSSQEVPA